VKNRFKIADAVGAIIVLGITAQPGWIEADDPSGFSPRDIEVGAVRWQRDLDAAFEASRRTGKPILAFFQEVPGCSGCQKFGASVMSYQPIVQAIEHEFLPVLIYNNRGGKDAEILNRYHEPAWNYQVIRFFDSSGRDLIPRKELVWTRGPLAVRMIQALEAAGRPVPGYLEVTAYEDNAELQEEAAFAQPCFWSGEVMLGRVPGVITTEAGWINGREVTLVHYRPDLVSLEALIDSAVAAGVAETVFLRTDEERQLVGRTRRLGVGSLDGTYHRARQSDQNRQIRDSVFAEIDLSPMQRTKINAFVATDMQQALSWLTPGQLAELETLEASP
jgi:peptide methionine sulfoxide reductase MsrA